VRFAQVIELVLVSANKRDGSVATMTVPLASPNATPAPMASLCRNKWLSHRTAPLKTK